MKERKRAKESEREKDGKRQSSALRRYAPLSDQQNVENHARFITKAFGAQRGRDFDARGDRVASREHREDRTDRPNVQTFENSLASEQSDIEDREFEQVEEVRVLEFSAEQHRDDRKFARARELEKVGSNGELYR